MQISTHTRRLVVVGLALIGLAVPVAQAGTPDAIDRYLANQADSSPAATPDAIDRYLANQADSSPAATPDAIDRYLANRLRASAPAVAATGVRVGGFDWGDFGVGIAATAGLALMLTGFGAAARVARQNRGRLGSI